MGVIAGTAAVLTVAVLAFIFLIVQDRMLEDSESHAGRELSALVNLVRVDLLTYNTSSIRAYLDRFGSDDTRWIAVFDRNDLLIEASTIDLNRSYSLIDSMWESEPLRAGQATVRRGILGRAVTGERGWVFLIPVDSDDGTAVWGRVYAGVSMEPTLHTVIRLRWFVIVSAGVVILLGWGFASVVSGRLTSPILRLVEQTSSVADGDLQRPLEGDYPDELGILFDGFRRMQHAVFTSRQELEERERREREDLEGQVQQLQRLESLGTLAGGIAHDFNNLLAIILGYADLLRRDPEITETAHKRVEQIQLSAKRGAGVVEQLLGFARKGKLVDQALSLNGVVHEVEGLVRFSLRPDVHIETDLSVDAPIIMGDPAQITQTVMNLVLNAIDAIDEGGGRVIIRTHHFAGSAAAGAGGSTASLEVEDNGGGIPEGIRDRMFEPFFSTKGTTDRTGLGLSMVFGIVKNHGGDIEVESELGHGTRIRILLPAVDSTAHAGEIEAAAALSHQAEEGMDTGHCLLLVDDEPAILELFQESFVDAGYKCLTASTGEEAVSLVRTRGEQIDAVILDLIMPGIGGAEAFTQLRGLRPDLPVIIASGYSRDGNEQDLLKKGAARVLRKPLELDTLHDAVRECLDQID